MANAQEPPNDSEKPRDLLGTVGVLRDLIELLVEYQLDQFAQFVDELLQLQSRDPFRFREEVTSNTLWGGAGSLCDLHMPSNRRGRAGVWQEQKRLDLTLVKLADELDAVGLGDDRTRSWAKTFVQWSEMGIYEHPPGESPSS